MFSACSMTRNTTTTMSTVLITGANSSLGLPLTSHLLTTSPSSTLLLTVRNPSPTTDPNTLLLAQTIASHPTSTALIEPLDLSSPSAIRSFAASLASRIAAGSLPPLAAIVCNAFTWSLSGCRTTTPDGIEETFQVTHLGHHLLVLLLLGSMSPAGRIVMLGSAAHDPGRPNPFSKLVAQLPANLDHLVNPPPDPTGEEHDRGFQRYANAKLANIIFMHELNRRLQQTHSTITATAIDPGGIVDSRAHVHQKPLARFLFFLINTLMPLLRHVTTDVRRAADSARDLATLSVGADFEGARGYFVGTRAELAAAVSDDAEQCRRLWDACWRWAGLTPGETVLANAAPTE